MIKLAYDNNAQQADLGRAAGLNLETDATLETAVFMSLFTRRLALADDTLPDPKGHREGWWADAYSDLEGDFIGSRLWLLSRSPTTNATLAQAKTYALEALQWLLDDGIASSVAVVVERQRDALVFQVQITRPNKLAPRWERTWQAHMELL